MKRNRLESTVLRDALYNLHPTSGATDEYRKGLLVGVVAGLIAAKGLSWEQAIQVCAGHLPAGAIVNADTVPQTWLIALTAEAERKGKRERA